MADQAHRTFPLAGRHGGSAAVRLTRRRARKPDFAARADGVPSRAFDRARRQNPRQAEDLGQIRQASRPLARSGRMAADRRDRGRPDGRRRHRIRASLGRRRLASQYRDHRFGTGRRGDAQRRLPAGPVAWRLPGRRRFAHADAAASAVADARAVDVARPAYGDRVRRRAGGDERDVLHRDRPPAAGHRRRHRVPRPGRRRGVHRARLARPRRHRGRGARGGPARGRVADHRAGGGGRAGRDLPRGGVLGGLHPARSTGRPRAGRGSDGSGRRDVGRRRGVRAVPVRRRGARAARRPPGAARRRDRRVLLGDPVRHRAGGAAARAGGDVRGAPRDAARPWRPSSAPSPCSRCRTGWTSSACCS